MNRFSIRAMAAISLAVAICATGLATSAVSAAGSTVVGAKKHKHHKHKKHKRPTPSGPSFSVLGFGVNRLFVPAGKTVSSTAQCSEMVDAPPGGVIGLPQTEYLTVYVRAANISADCADELRGLPRRGSSGVQPADSDLPRAAYDGLRKGRLLVRQPSRQPDGPLPLRAHERERRIRRERGTLPRIRRRLLDDGDRRSRRAQTQLDGDRQRELPAAALRAPAHPAPGGGRRGVGRGFGLTTQKTPPEREEQPFRQPPRRSIPSRYRGRLAAAHVFDASANTRVLQSPRRGSPCSTPVESLDLDVEHDDGRPLLGRKLRGKSEREMKDLGLAIEK